MPRVIWAGIASAILLVFAQASWAQSAEQLLLELTENSLQQSYQGSFIYERKNVFSTHQVWKLVNGQQLQERFVRTSGQKFETRRQNGQISCINSGSVAANEEQQLWSQQKLDLARLSEFYTIKLLGQSRVANRTALAVLFAPNDQYRYPLELHFDEPTGVVLKSLLLNEEGLLLERFQFVTFEPEFAPAESIAASDNDCIAISQQHTQQIEPNGKQWHFQWLPDGFVQITSQQTQQLVSQSFSDGLSHFSVFIEQLEEQGAAAARHQLGPTAVVSRRLETPFGAYMLTVMGEVPALTAERIAMSIRLQQD